MKVEATTKTVASSVADSMAAAGGGGTSGSTDSMAAAGGAVATGAADAMEAAGGAAASLSVDADMSIKVESRTATAASSAADSVAPADSAAASSTMIVDMRPFVSIKLKSSEPVAEAADGIDDGWYMTGCTGGTAEDFEHLRRFRKLVE